MDTNRSVARRAGGGALRRPEVYGLDDIWGSGGWPSFDSDIPLL